MFTFDVKNNDGVVEVNLKGRLDATVAPQLHAELEKLTGSDVKKVVFYVKDLEYIASAGLRVILFSKQKLGADTEVIMKDVKDEVRSVIEMTGFNSFITME